MTIKIRNEEIKDYRVAEELTRKAFWSLHVPGCEEHYLVHVLRNHKDFELLEKEYSMTQELFYIDSHSTISE